MNPEPLLPHYGTLQTQLSSLLEAARNAAARSVNAVMTATYWELGRQIVAFEQGGESRAEYGEALLKRLAADLTAQFGRGFGWRNLTQMRSFYLAWQPTLQTPSAISGSTEISQTPSAKLEPVEIIQTPSEEFGLTQIAQTASAQSITTHLQAIARNFPLPWSAYVRLLSVKSPDARRFYEAEALRGGWSVRQLNRQIESQFYERSALSKNKDAMLKKGATAVAGDTPTLAEVIKDPYVLEFLNLKDEYSETDLEDALIHRLEDFLLELGGDFAFMGRQKRLRVGDAWYRVDLLFFHRRLRALVVIDLKLGSFTHADAGQMHLYLNYAREHWMQPSENPPVGLILCAQKDAAVAHYALEGLGNTVLAAEYRTWLPDEARLAQELDAARRLIEARASAGGGA